jgi:programmed cell death 8 (apoptosis-inducing factor)
MRVPRAMPVTRAVPGAVTAGRVAKRFMAIRMAGEGSVQEGPDWKKIGTGALAVLVVAKFMTEVKTSMEKNKAPPPELVSQKPDKTKEGAWTEPLKTAGAPIATGDAAPAPAPAATVVETAAPEEVTEVAPKEEAPTVKRPIQNYSATYVIVGTGTAAYFAVRGIVEKDPNAKIIMIGEESYPPYMRTPLSKELWFRENAPSPDSFEFTDWGGEKRSIFYEKPEFFTDVDKVSGPNGVPGTALLLGNRVVDMNVHAKRLKLANGDVVKYDKCLLATGGTPRSIPLLDEADDAIRDKVKLYRSIKQFETLAATLGKEETKSIAVIGGGFLGSELSVALAHAGQKCGVTVTQVYPEDGNMAKVLPAYLSKWSTEKVRKEGVTIVPNTRLVGVKKAAEGAGLELELSSGQILSADEVVVAVGIEPSIELAKKARLEVDPVKGGILVNAELEARTDLWVAGDVASFYDVVLGRRREEHHDHAVVSGRLAGENMTGARKSYTHQSMFWSDLGPEIGYEAIGIIDAKLPTVGVWAAANTPASSPEDVGAGAAPAADSSLDGYGKGVVFYMRDDAVVGVVLWNVFDKIPLARKVIRSQKKYTDARDLAKLFKIHEEESK